MPDRVKVIERLSRVSYYFKSLLEVGWQGDADIYREYRESVNMALALLREREPVKPENGFPDLKCPNCGTAFVSEVGYCLGKPIAEYYRHCPGCGRGIKWDAAD